MKADVEYVTVSTIPGVSFRQTLKAPVDYIEIHPFQLGQIIQHMVSVHDGYIDIIHSAEPPTFPEFVSGFSEQDLEHARQFCRKEGE